MTECIICFNMLYPKQKTVSCTICNIVVHKTCYDDWCRITPHRNTPCIYCRQYNTFPKKRMCLTKCCLRLLYHCFSKCTCCL